MMDLRTLAAAATVVLSACWATASGATSLVMFEEPGCAWCARWNAEIAPIYDKTAEGRAAPLRRVDIRAQSGEPGLERAVVFTPTFVLVHDGAEVARIEGYPGEDFFWGLMARMLEQLPTPAADGEENK